MYADKDSQDRISICNMTNEQAETLSIAAIAAATDQLAETTQSRFLRQVADELAQITTSQPQTKINKI